MQFGLFASLVKGKAQVQFFVDLQDVAVNSCPIVSIVPSQAINIKGKGKKDINSVMRELFLVRKHLTEQLYRASSSA